jgi:hypothetical protein
MTADRDWERVKTLFHAAVDIAPDARHAFVKEQADDPVSWRKYCRCCRHTRRPRAS